MAAASATRMMLLKNGMSSPLQLLRAPLFGASTNINIQTQFISDPTRLQPHSPIFPQYFLGDQAHIGVANGSSAIDAGNINSLLGWRFGEFGEMGRLEARGRRVVIDDDNLEDDSDVDGEFDDEVAEDFDQDFDDEDADGDEIDDDDVVDVKK